MTLDQGIWAVIIWMNGGMVGIIVAQLYHGRRLKMLLEELNRRDLHDLG